MEILTLAARWSAPAEELGIISRRLKLSNDRRLGPECDAVTITGQGDESVSAQAL